MSTTMSIKMRRTIKQIMRQNGFWIAGVKTHRIDNVINQRARLAQAIAAATVDNRYGVIIRGMDCDGTRYERETIEEAPRSIYAFWRETENAAAYLDGPCNTFYVRPEEVRDGYYASRDLALEAHENGHPHVLAA